MDIISFLTSVLFLDNFMKKNNSKGLSQQIDFSRLYNEYNSFWKLHNYQKALQTLKNINDYMGGNMFLISYESLLKPENLASRYAVDLGLSVSEVAKNFSYNELISYFGYYLDLLVKEVYNNEQRIKAQNEANIFNQIIKAISDTIGTVGSVLPYALPILIGLVIYNISKK